AQSSRRPQSERASRGTIFNFLSNDAVSRLCSNTLTTEGNKVTQAIKVAKAGSSSFRRKPKQSVPMPCTNKSAPAVGSTGERAQAPSVENRPTTGPQKPTHKP